MARMIAGRYRVVGELGRGGTGVVWKAWDERLNRNVAIKELTLPQDVGDDERAATRRRFLREARAVAALDHPNIVAVHDVVEEPDVYLVMQYVQGTSLQDADVPLPPERVRALGLALLDALRAAHAQGIVHRDVKPANVLLADSGGVVLADFGIAAMTDATHTLTRTGLVVGSLGYIAPERFSSGTTGPESDLWSLGATLYYAAVGKRAYRADEGLEPHLGRLMLGDDPDLAKAGPLGPVIAGLMVKDPAHRWDHERARRALNGEDTGPTRTMPPALRPAPRGNLRRAAVAGGAALALVLAATAVYAAVRDGSPGEPRPTASPSPTLYARMPDFCDYMARNRMRGWKELTASELGVDSANNSREANCGWKSERGTLSLVVGAKLYDDDAAAAAEMAKIKPGRSPYADETTSRVENDQIGDEAMQMTADEKRGKDSVTNATTVWFRHDNLVVSAHYSYTDDAVILGTDGKAVAADLARQFARQLDGFLDDEPENAESPIRGVPTAG
ncbi:serine/threonine-protein kinase [Actinomadura atramentaria]|uniref:serine/threonine-protein kinase n=1 Tax=Actinomadura atramentaria TaxID=1990 RepID=UPI00146B7C37|nr:serine/threonine-protein kinase [Actinomadura atramentaria]